MQDFRLCSCGRTAGTVKEVRLKFLASSCDLYAGS